MKHLLYSLLLISCSMFAMEDLLRNMMTEQHVNPSDNGMAQLLNQMMPDATPNDLIGQTSSIPMPTNFYPLPEGLLENEISNEEADLEDQTQSMNVEAEQVLPSSIFQVPTDQQMGMEIEEEPVLPTSIFKPTAEQLSEIAMQESEEKADEESIEAPSIRAENETNEEAMQTEQEISIPVADNFKEKKETVELDKSGIFDAIEDEIIDSPSPSTPKPTLIVDHDKIEKEIEAQETKKFEREIALTDQILKGEREIATTELKKRKAETLNEFQEIKETNRNMRPAIKMITLDLDADAQLIESQNLTEQTPMPAAVEIIKSNEKRKTFPLLNFLIEKENQKKFAPATLTAHENVYKNPNYNTIAHEATNQPFKISAVVAGFPRLSVNPTSADLRHESIVDLLKTAEQYIEKAKTKEAIRCIMLARNMSAGQYKEFFEYLNALLTFHNLNLINKTISERREIAYKMCNDLNTVDGEKHPYLKAAIQVLLGKLEAAGNGNRPANMIKAKELFESASKQNANPKAKYDAYLNLGILINKEKKDDANAQREQAYNYLKKAFDQNIFEKIHVQAATHLSIIHAQNKEYPKAREYALIAMNQQFDKPSAFLGHMAFGILNKITYKIGDSIITANANAFEKHMTIAARQTLEPFTSVAAADLLAKHYAKSQLYEKVCQNYKLMIKSALLLPAAQETLEMLSQLLIHTDPVMRAIGNFFIGELYYFHPAIKNMNKAQEYFKSALNQANKNNDYNLTRMIIALLCQLDLNNFDDLVMYIAPAKATEVLTKLSQNTKMPILALYAMNELAKNAYSARNIEKAYEYYEQMVTQSKLLDNPTDALDILRQLFKNDPILNALANRFIGELYYRHHAIKDMKKAQNCFEYAARQNHSEFIKQAAIKRLEHLKLTTGNSK